MQVDTDEKKQTCDFPLQAESFLTKNTQSTIDSNIKLLLRDDKVHDVTFQLTFENETKEYKCVKFLFAAQSSVFRHVGHLSTIKLSCSKQTLLL